MSGTGITIATTAAEKKEFVDFLYRHYQDDKFFVPPLRMDQKKLIDTAKNPFFDNAEIALFLAEKDGQTVGRIAAIVDHRYNEHHGTKTGHFGFFECINDQHTANMLFRVAGDWLRDKGMDEMLGPASPSMMDIIGVLVDGFYKHPFVMMPYNKTFYDDLIKKSGLEKSMDLYAYMVDKDSLDRSRMDRATEIVYRRNPGLKLREIQLKEMDKEIQIVREIFNKAWAENWGFIPLTEAEFQAAGKDLKMIVDQDYAHIAEIDGKPVAFSVALPDINQILKDMDGKLFPFGLFKILIGKRNIDMIRTALMGVLPEFQGRGIDALLHQKAIVNGMENGVMASELSWILETNTQMIRVAERIGGRLDKTYRMYTRSL